MTLIHDPITFILICLTLHCIADFNLQFGAHLGDFKRRRWWTNVLGPESYPGNHRNWNKYGNDYISALLIHAFVWSVVTFLPYLVIEHYDCWKMLVTVILNTGLHAWIDHLKCNKRLTNLNQDQLIHFLQVIGFGLLLWFI